MTTAIYQIGVDVLGFPIYLEHKIYEVKQKKQDGSRHIPKTIKREQIVIENIVKQH